MKNGAAYEIRRIRLWMQRYWSAVCNGLAASSLTSVSRIVHLASVEAPPPCPRNFKKRRSTGNTEKTFGGWCCWRITVSSLPVLALFFAAPLVCAQGLPSLMAPAAYNAQPGTVPTGVVTGMFSSSGFLDFAVLEQNPNTGLDQVEIFHGNANGSFCTNCSGGTPDPDLIPLGPSGSTVRGSSIAVGQFRSSTGFLDIAVATTTGIVFLQNNGSGTFTLNDSLTLSSGNSFTSLVVGMFKGDGNYDIAAVSQAVSGSVPLTVFIGDGSGDFTPSAPYSVSNTYAQCTAIMQSNFQSQTTQSDLALLCSSPSEASVLVYLNNLDGSGNFTAGQIPYTGSAFGGTLPGVALGTLNGQAAIFVSSVSSSFQSYQSNGLAGLSNVFTSVSMIPVGLAPRGSLAVLYDPSTGAVDYAVANNGVSLSTFTSYTASGTSIDGTWASTASLGPGESLAAGFSPNLNQGAAYVAIGAGVHDGTYPNFESYVDERSIGVFLVTLNSDGTVASTNAAPVYTGTGANGYSFPPSFATGDFNNDGILDVAVAGANDATGNATVTMYLANADGSIPTTTSVPVVTVNNTDYSGADAVVAGKFRPTQSGQTSPYYDLAVFSSGQVFVLLSTGDGTFGAQTSIPLSGDPNYPGFEYNPSAGHPFAPVLTAADVNGDGLDDIVLTLPEYNCNGSGAVSQGAVYVLISNGDGTFQNPVFVAPPVVNPVSAAAAKFYGTSVPDLVFADGGEFCGGNSATTTGTAVGILQNNVPANSSSVSASEFTASAVLTQSSDLAMPNVTAVASADFNGDGQPDLAVSNTNGVQVLLNQGSGVFSATTQGILPLYTGDVVPGPLCNSTSGYVGCVTYDSQVATGSFFAAGENDVAASVNGVAYVFQNLGAGILSAPTQGFAAGPNSTMISGALSNSNGLNGLLLATSQGTAYLMNGGAQPSPSYAMYSPTIINFGSVQVDSITTQQLTLTNTGGLPFNVTQIAVSGTPGFSLASAVCNGVTFSSSATLNAGASCIFTVQFAPTKIVKHEIGGQITITDSAAGSNAASSGSGQIIYLVGTVVSIPTATALSISPGTGTAGSPVTLTAKVTTSSGNVGSFGTVTFYNGATVLGSSPVNGGAGSIIVSNLAAGTYSISAVYQDSTHTYAVSTSLTKVFLVIPVQLDPPQIAQAFGVPSIPLNGITSLTFTIRNPNSSSTLAGVAFTDSFPSGLAVASPSNLTSNCGGANAGSASVSLSGATLPAAGSCTISLNVTGTSTGTITNSVTVTSAQTPTGNTAAASLLIQAGLFSPTSGTRGETLNVTITGSGFVSGVTTVTFGPATDGVALNSVTVTDSGHLTANITISSTAKLGKLAVTVITGMSQLRPGNFVVQAPTLTVSPNTGTAGETLNVTLTGWTFPSGTTVTFGNNAS
ncbi:MAG: FG-GAP-like repeat-containing protein, partial [Candidatus Sulfotelmatobacter sp.]